MASVVVELDDKPLERVPADLVVVGFSPDDRPLHGSAGRADWRLCGELWGLVTSRKLHGTLGKLRCSRPGGRCDPPCYWFSASGTGPNSSSRLGASWVATSSGACST